MRRDFRLEQVKWDPSLAWLLLLCVLDGFFTAVYLSLGAQEANPVFFWALDSWGIPGLLWLKFSITLPCLAVLQVFSHVPFAKRGVQLLLGIYGILLLYHLWAGVIIFF